MKVRTYLNHYIFEALDLTYLNNGLLVSWQLLAFTFFVKIAYEQLFIVDSVVYEEDTNVL